MTGRLLFCTFVIVLGVTCASEARSKATPASVSTPILSSLVTTQNSTFPTTTIPSTELPTTAHRKSANCIVCHAGNASSINATLLRNELNVNGSEEPWCRDEPEQSITKDCQDPEDVCLALTVAVDGNVTVVARGCAQELLNTAHAYKLRPLLNNSSALCYSGVTTPTRNDYTQWPQVAGCACLGEACNKMQPTFANTTVSETVECRECDYLDLGGSITNTCTSESASSCLGNHCAITYSSGNYSSNGFNYTSKVYQAYCINSTSLPNCTDSTFLTPSAAGEFSVRFCKGEPCPTPKHMPPLSNYLCKPPPVESTTTTTTSTTTLPTTTKTPATTTITSDPHRVCYYCTDTVLEKIPNRLKDMFNIPSFYDSRCGTNEYLFPEMMDTTSCMEPCVTFKAFDATGQDEMTIRGCSQFILKSGPMEHLRDIIDHMNVDKFTVFGMNNVLSGVESRSFENGSFAACDSDRCNDYLPKETDVSLAAAKCKKGSCRGTHCMRYGSDYYCMNSTLPINKKYCFTDIHGKIAKLCGIKFWFKNCQTSKYCFGETTTETSTTTTRERSTSPVQSTTASSTAVSTTLSTLQHRWLMTAVLTAANPLGQL